MLTPRKWRIFTPAHETRTFGFYPGIAFMNSKIYAFSNYGHIYELTAQGAEIRGVLTPPGINHTGSRTLISIGDHELLLKSDDAAPMVCDLNDHYKLTTRNLCVVQQECDDMPYVKATYDLEGVDIVTTTAEIFKLSIKSCTIRVYNKQTFRLQRQWRFTERTDETGWTFCLDVDEKEERVYILDTQAKEITVWTYLGKRVRTYSGVVASVIALAPSFLILASGKTLTIRRRSTGALYQRLTFPANIHTLRISPSGDIWISMTNSLHILRQGDKYLSFLDGTLCERSSVYRAAQRSLYDHQLLRLVLVYSGHIVRCKRRRDSE